MFDMVIFDLDGTLLDTSLGIYNSVRYTERKMGFSPIPDIELKEFVGPPPKQMYKIKYHISDEAAMMATEFHREYGMTNAIYEAKIYEGIEALLIELHNIGVKMAVATLKKQEIAIKILENNNLIDYFDIVVGMDDTESFTKADTIEIAMKACRTTNAVMIGDSLYDYEGAQKVGIDFIGVLYGFGFLPSVQYDFFAVSETMQLLDRILK